MAFDPIAHGNQLTALAVDTLNNALARCQVSVDHHEIQYGGEDEVNTAIWHLSSNIHITWDTLKFTLYLDGPDAASYYRASYPLTHAGTLAELLANIRLVQANPVTQLINAN